MDSYSYLAPGEALPPEVSDVITDANFAHVSFTGTQEELPNANGCHNPNVHENLTYWWCNGTQTQISLGLHMPKLDPNWGDVNSSIIDRLWNQNRATAVVPVYVQVPDGEGGVALQLAYFVAVDLHYSVSDKVLTMNLRTDYVTAGAMVGEGSGVETGVWAVNLKR
jgi:hypothetical protein